MQIFTTVAAPSTIAFIVQDLGDQDISAWVLQVGSCRTDIHKVLLGRRRKLTKKPIGPVVGPGRLEPHHWAPV